MVCRDTNSVPLAMHMALKLMHMALKLMHTM